MMFLKKIRNMKKKTPLRWKCVKKQVLVIQMENDKRHGWWFEVFQRPPSVALLLPYDRYFVKLIISQIDEHISLLTGLFEKYQTIHNVVQKQLSLSGYTKTFYFQSVSVLLALAISTLFVSYVVKKGFILMKYHHSFCLNNLNFMYQACDSYLDIHSNFLFYHL